MPGYNAIRTRSVLLACLVVAACHSQAPSPSGRAAAPLVCEDWNTDEFFEAATLSDVRRCLESGAEANAADKYKITPLHRAGSAAVVRALVAAGGDANAHTGPSFLGETPLDWAKNAEVAIALLEAGADPMVRDSFGFTPLHSASTAAIAKVVLDAGVSPHVRTYGGETPLHWAKDAAIAKVLLQAGASAVERDVDEFTPLNEARSAEIVNLLLQAGADVNARGYTILRRSIRFRTPAPWRRCWKQVQMSKRERTAA